MPHCVGEDHIHKGENFHPRVVNCVSACTTITDKILTLSFFLLFPSSLAVRFFWAILPTKKGKKLTN